MFEAAGNHKHFFPIVEAMAAEAVEDLRKAGAKVSCRKGCSHCCYLLIELSWEEAMVLAQWVESLPYQERMKCRQRITKNASEAREFFGSKANTRIFMQPVTLGTDFPSKAFDGYFYEGKRPCPFLSQGSCTAYAVRPIPCRLHMVTSPAELCSRTVLEEDEYEIPERIVQLQEEVGPIARALQPDPRCGHMSIMIEAALAELDGVKISENADFKAVG